MHMHKHTGTRNVLSLKFPPPDDGCDASSSLFSLLSSLPFFLEVQWLDVAARGPQQRPPAASTFLNMTPVRSIGGAGHRADTAPLATLLSLPLHGHGSSDDTGGQKQWCWSPGRHLSTGDHVTPATGHLIL